MTLGESFDRELRDKFVRPFYLQLLGGNFTRANEPEASGFRHAVAASAGLISDDQIATLLTEREWRGRLAAAWFVGLTQRANFVPTVGKLLLASELVYAGQGYCVALGLIGGEECRCILRDYLNAYLPLNGRVYDQAWAVGALTHLEGLGSAGFLDRQLWRDGNYFMDPEKGIESFSRVILYLRHHRMIDAAA
jgi:hypothetical protein